MCGVGGIITVDPSSEWKRDLIEQLLIQAKLRGDEATGISFVGKDSEMVVVKDGVSADKFIVSPEFKDVADKFPSIVMAHARAATKGIDVGPEKNMNNHPFYAEEGRIALMHNGTIKDDDRWRESAGRPGALRNAPISKVDSEVMLRAIETNYLTVNKGNMMKAIDNAAYSVAGNYVLGIQCSDFPNKIWLVRHGNPLHIGFLPSKKTIIFASTSEALAEVVSTYNTYLGYFYDIVRPKMIVNSVRDDTVLEIEVLVKEPWFKLTSKHLDIPTDSSRSEREIVESAEEAAV